ncbi:uncharacterized protein BT62DRAFT_1079159 [Guyanagaster necrorhizus]|uniref:Uncharacterized protein n=1 Tax=Guyanagaster necrorhizus TaxID=856835 RepID=A0A9P8AP87_9AGAR|nr:uncharacterized protein BT62DRAFT_1079159 [Guyanagaster necrorhizus MCA 3950]KAG7442551.1 hypothetical protein BT62DRAFT_1079159 [Guyanagaster necrorhizus MCA 3950]
MLRLEMAPDVSLGLHLSCRTEHRMSAGKDESVREREWVFGTGSRGCKLQAGGELRKRCPNVHVIVEEPTIFAQFRRQFAKEVPGREHSLEEKSFAPHLSATIGHYLEYETERKGPTPSIQPEGGFADRSFTSALIIEMRSAGPFLPWRQSVRQSSSGQLSLAINSLLFHVLPRWRYLSVLVTSTRCDTLLQFKQEWQTLPAFVLRGAIWGMKYININFALMPIGASVMEDVEGTDDQARSFPTKNMMDFSTMMDGRDDLQTWGQIFFFPALESTSSSLAMCRPFSPTLSEDSPTSRWIAEANGAESKSR